MKNSIIDFKNNIKTLMSNEQTPLNLSRVTNKSQSKADIVQGLREKYGKVQISKNKVNHHQSHQQLYVSRERGRPRSMVRTRLQSHFISPLMNSHQNRNNSISRIINRPNQFHFQRKYMKVKNNPMFQSAFITHDSSILRRRSISPRKTFDSRQKPG